MPFHQDSYYKLSKKSNIIFATLHFYQKFKLNGHPEYFPSDALQNGLF